MNTHSLNITQLEGASNVSQGTENRYKKQSADIKSRHIFLKIYSIKRNIRCSIRNSQQTLETVSRQQKQSADSLISTQ